MHTVISKFIFGLKYIILGLSSIIVWEVARRFYLSLRRSKPTKRFWDFLHEDVCLILSAPHRTVDGQLMSWSSFGDVLSYNKIFNFFVNKTRGKIISKNRLEFLNSEQEWELQKGKNLVILGGPFYNRVVKSILSDIYAELTEESQGKFLNTVGFWRDRFYVPDRVEPTYGTSVYLESERALKSLSDVAFSTRDGGTNYTPRIGRRTRSGSDYGIIIKSINPYSQNKKVVILYGAYDYGTTGAAQFAITDEYIKQLLESTKLTNNIWGLVEVTVRKGNFSKVELKAYGGFSFSE